MIQLSLDKSTQNMFEHSKTCAIEFLSYMYTNNTNKYDHLFNIQ